MKKSEVIEIVFTSVNGGRPNTDSAVQREDIRALLPAAVNFAMTGDYWGNMKAEGDKEVPYGIISEQELTPISKDTKGNYYVAFNKPLINAGGHSGIRYIQDDCGNNYYPISPSVGRNQWNDILDGYKGYTYIKGKIKITNKSPLVTKLIGGFIFDCSLLADDDELPIPSGLEPQVIDQLTGFFTNQRMQPKDYVIDGKDPLKEL